LTDINFQSAVNIENNYVTQLVEILGIFVLNWL